MNDQSNILLEFENNKTGFGTLFTIIACINSLLIISAATYFVWLFKMPVFELLRDSELQVLLCIHIIYPLIGLSLFVSKKKLGWSLTLFHSVLNVAYAIVVLLTELEFDMTTPFFLIHSLLVGLLYQKSVRERCNISRKWFLTTAFFSLSVGLTFAVIVILT